MKLYGTFIFIVIAVSLFAASSARSNNRDPPTCSTDDDCSYDDVCHGGQCLDACLFHNGERVGNRCGANAGCYMVKNHISGCVCDYRYAGNPYTGCTPMPDPVRPCNADNDCQHYDLCHEGGCVDVCKYRNGKVADSKCGTNARCYYSYPHQADCECPPNYGGDPFIACVKNI